MSAAQSSPVRQYKVWLSRQASDTPLRWLRERRRRPTLKLSLCRALLLTQMSITFQCDQVEKVSQLHHPNVLKHHGLIETVDTERIKWLDSSFPKLCANLNSLLGKWTPTAD